MTRELFHLVLIKPSHYDDDGYVIQWFRAAFPSNSLAVMNSLAQDCQQRRVLGDRVDIAVTILDETNARVRPDKIAEKLSGERGLVALVGVQTNQFPRALDIARPLRTAGIPVCIGGFHVSGSLAMSTELPGELTEALADGISLFAGEAEGRLEQVLRDAYQGRLQSIYNYLSEPPPLENSPLPLLPTSQVKLNIGRLTCFDAGRGCPFQCSFCTIINVQGRKPRQRTAGEVEQIVRNNLAQGNNRFFITDDNFARNRNWESIFDRLIEMRSREKLNIKFVLQVDANCHRIPRFIEKASLAGVARVFIGLESIQKANLESSRKVQNNIAEYRRMLLQWKRCGVTVIGGYIVGFPQDTPESISNDIETIKRELPVDLLEFTCMTPLPGSEDFQQLRKTTTQIDPDLNRYDLEHVIVDHPVMTHEQWEQAYRNAWRSYYSPEHYETVLRRLVTFGSAGGNLPLLMTWFFNYCFSLEKVHPLQGGYWRRRYRRDRRPRFRVESRILFYSRYFIASLGKFWRYFGLLWLVWHYSRLRRQLRRDGTACSYSDAALREDETVMDSSDRSVRSDRSV